MKTLTKSLALVLALVLALLVAFGISASAAASDLPDNLDALPELTLGTTAEGTIKVYVTDDDLIWYAFTPTQAGYYLFPTTGSYDNSSPGVYDAFHIYATGFASDGSFKWTAPYYEQGETCYVRMYASGPADTSVAYSVTPKLYQYAEPLKATKGYFYYGPFYKISDLLEGSSYTMDDIEYWSCRGALRSRVTFEQFYVNNNYDTEGYIDLYFKDGVYTVVANDAGGIYDRGGISGLIESIREFLAGIPIFGSFLSFLLAPLFWLLSLFA